MKKNVKMALVVVAAVIPLLVSGCVGQLQNVRDINVNHEGTITALRIDEQSIGLWQNMSDFGWTYVVLERHDRGVSYEIVVDLSALNRECRVSGFFYDTATTEALFELRRFDRTLRISEPLYPLIDRWNEALAECR